MTIVIRLILGILSFTLDFRACFTKLTHQYFNAEIDGCERIRRIAGGDFSFSDQPR